MAELLLLSRAIDDIEENELVPDKKILYQFSARGHELAQILLGMQLTDPNDAAKRLLPFQAPYAYTRAFC